MLRTRVAAWIGCPVLILSIAVLAAYATDPPGGWKASEGPNSSNKCWQSTENQGNCYTFGFTCYTRGQSGAPGDDLFTCEGNVLGWSKQMYWRAWGGCTVLADPGPVSCFDCFYCAVVGAYATSGCASDPECEIWIYASSACDPTS